MSDIQKEAVTNPVEVKPVETTDATKTDSKTKDGKSKEKKEKKPRRKFKTVMRVWSKGLSKEASRVTWENKRDVLKDFITIVIVCVFLAVVFFAIDMIVITIKH